MENKFTPGPWKFVELVTPDEQYCGKIVQADDVWEICEVFAAATYYEDFDTDNESLANARLIAAGPEMYELLKEILTEGKVHAGMRPEITALLTRISTPS